MFQVTREVLSDNESEYPTLVSLNLPPWKSVGDLPFTLVEVGFKLKAFVTWYMEYEYLWKVLRY